MQPMWPAGGKIDGGCETMTDYTTGNDIETINPTKMDGTVSASDAPATMR